ncbi:MAG: hypothetical protein JWM20_173 [Patescibacteria group bacterium]|nr:hypothetical protein [Patescibacteria group bacterium]
MKKYSTKTYLVSTIAGLAALFAFPALSLASNYTVSPQVSGFTLLSVTQAAVVCQSLPDAIAAQMSFCRYNTGGTVITTGSPVISNIMVTNLTSTGAMISWTTDQPTTTLLWYTANPTTPNVLSGYANPSQGYSTNHNITLSGINTGAGHTFSVGGNSSGGAFGSSTIQAFPAGTSMSYNPTFSVSNVTNNAATLNIGANMPVRATVSYYGPNGNTLTANSGNLYGMSNTIYLNNLSSNTNYRGTVTVYDQSGNVVGTYQLNTTTNY